MNEIRTIEHDASPAVTVPFKIDVSRGTTRTDVNKQWASRPDDEKYLSLDAIYEATNRRRIAALEAVIRPDQMKVRGSQENPRDLSVLMPDGQAFAPSHFAVGQLAQLGGAGAAAGFIRRQPSWLAAANLQFALTVNRDTPTKVYADMDSGLLRAATGPDYGRIFDASLVGAVQKFAGNGTGDTRWKVPGMIDWRTMHYNPHVAIDTQTTTLYASDRDVFLFLVDDTNPFEIGKLPNGDPDLVFRGFYCWNSEVGTRSLGIATFFLRGVCQNRCIWGTENFSELKIIHSKGGANRFAYEAEPALQRYAASEPTSMLAGIRTCKEAKIGFEDDNDRLKFLSAKDLGLGGINLAEQVMATFEREEGGRIETVWDAAMGITAVARTIPNQDKRIDMEKVAAKLMDRATRGRKLIDA